MLARVRMPCGLRRNRSLVGKLISDMVWRQSSVLQTQVLIRQLRDLLIVSRDNNCLSTVFQLLEYVDYSLTCP